MLILRAMGHAATTSVGLVFAAGHDAVIRRWMTEPVEKRAAKRTGVDSI